MWLGLMVRARIRAARWGLGGLHYARLRGLRTTGRRGLAGVRVVLGHRRIVSAVVTVTLTAALTAAAWSRYETANPVFPPMPDVAEEAAVSFFLPEDITDTPQVELWAIRERVTYSVRFHSRSRCIHVGAAFIYGAVPRNSGASMPETLLAVSDPPVSRYLYRICQDRDVAHPGGVYLHEFAVNTNPAGRMVGLNGYRGAIWTPEVTLAQLEMRSPSDMPKCRYDCRLAYGRSLEWEFSVSVGLDIDHYRVDNANPAPSSWFGGLAWEFPPAEAMVNGVRATFVDLQGEATAERDLFISGVLAGIAGGFATWALQIMLEFLPARRRRRDDAHRGENT